MKLLILGDIFGENGKRAIKNELLSLRYKHNVDFVIANGENTTCCRGLNEADYNFLLNNGVDFITMGNHTWRQDDYITVLNKPNIIRPINIDNTSTLANIGKGYTIININGKKVRIFNALSKAIVVKNISLTNPFKKIIDILDNEEKVDINIIDYHADTTSEKNAAFLIFKNKVQLIYGTHSHVQTNDAKIIDHTAYITDVGMCGPTEGIIGANPEPLINMFMEYEQRFKLTEASGKYQLCAILVEINDLTNKPILINPITIIEQ